MPAEEHSPSSGRYAFLIGAQDMSPDILPVGIRVSLY